MNGRVYPGARWWSFDFHTHTPASQDFKDKRVTPHHWLQYFMEKRIDCVAITDHNSGEWIDKLKEALEELKECEKKPPYFHPLVLFPGVEISVHSGIHMLGIFDPTKGTSDIDLLLGAVGYKKIKGGDGETTKTISDVSKIIVEHGGLPIPAHADKEKGLLKALKGIALKEALRNSAIDAMELCDLNFSKPQIYKEEKIRWAEIRGSDIHSLEQKDKKYLKDREHLFTWIKMSQASIEGLKLALTDGGSLIHLGSVAHPNHIKADLRDHSEFIIEKMEVKEAKYMGRAQDFCVSLSPYLNTIIGGRGSGKSTLLEFMRLVLRRQSEIPDSLKEENQKYFGIEKEHLLCEDSHLSLIYRKGETRYRLNWSVKGEMGSLEVETEEGQWKVEDGEIKTLFPVYIYSQKQIFSLAQKPDALLSIIDKDPQVKYKEWEQKHTELMNRYKQLKQKSKEINDKILKKDEWSGQLIHTQRKIEEIEKSGHKEILERYRLRQRQLSVIEGLKDSWKQTVSSLEKTKKDINPVPFDKKLFKDHDNILKEIQDHYPFEKVSNQLENLIREAQDFLSKWKEKEIKSPWMQKLKEDIEEYKNLEHSLSQQGIDLSKYPQLLEQYGVYQKELGQISELSQSLQKMSQESKQVLQDIFKNRKNLTENRKLFLKSISKGHSSVNIEIKPFGQIWSDIAIELRELIQCQNTFDGDFELLKKIYSDSECEVFFEEIKKVLSNLFQEGEESIDKRSNKSQKCFHNYSNNHFSNRFQNRIKNLPQESISDLECWFPEDSLSITFHTTKEKDRHKDHRNKDHRPQNIQQGSPGQKTAALLAFILSYGREPLLLDQPEDDLDNELIYDLIVKQLCETKSQRQIIVVTHNANIVVNGNAELVLPLTVREGESHLDNPESIQDKSIRKKICNVLEGGAIAFEQRYKRIHLGTNDAG